MVGYLAAVERDPTLALDYVAPVPDVPDASMSLVFAANALVVATAALAF